MREELVPDQPIGALVTRLVDDGKAYVRAEIAVAKLTVTTRIAAVVPSIVLGACALLLVIAALTVLVAALGLSLARWLGVAGGLAVGGVIALLLAALLGWIAAARLTGKP